MTENTGTSTLAASGAEGAIRIPAREAEPWVSTLLGGLQESAPQAIDALAKRYRAEGRPVIAFGAGEPDFDTPAHIVDAVREALSDPATYHYSPPAGLPALRSAVATEVAGYTGLNVDASEVMVSNGGKQAIYNALTAVLDPGDEVIIPAPYWTSYPEQVALAGGVPVPVATGPESEFKATVASLEAARTERTRLLIVTSPSNPTGSVYTEDELREIAEWANSTGIWVLTDEMYRHFVYDGAEFSSIAPFVQRNRLLIVGGLAKSHVLTGWRLGWVVSTPRIVQAMTSFQSHTTGNVSNVSQHAALAALVGGDAFPEQMRQVFERRRQLALAILERTPGFTVTPPSGAFYFFVDARGALGGELQLGEDPVRTSMQLSTLLLERIDVAVVPGEAFGAPGFLRFSYALDDAQLTEGLERIRELLASELIA
ncbi:pyridoxal phosphate-dependent aminotransferase [Leucobacter sp. USHLN153]|uniref:pyridoxal phosphate-dependent aminotransferase n=1 Tax=Leucobacter sp. USHLN153 TaxID=3081268 RepID=UPI00301AC229